MLSCDVIIWDDKPPFLIFPENFTHSIITVLFWKFLMYSFRCASDEKIVKKYYAYNVCSKHCHLKGSTSNCSMNIRHWPEPVSMIKTWKSTVVATKMTSCLPLFPRSMRLRLFVSVWQVEALLILAGKGANAWFSFYNSCSKDFGVTCHPTFIFHAGLHPDHKYLSRTFEQSILM